MAWKLTLTKFDTTSSKRMQRTVALNAQPWVPQNSR